MPDSLSSRDQPVDRFVRDPRPSVLVFAGPKAGSGAGRDQIPRLLKRLRKLSIAAELDTTVPELKARIDHIARPIVVAAGGDGTLALAAASVAANVPVLPMPLGTENLLARHFGHRADAEAVLHNVRHGIVTPIDAGLANGKPFLIMASCGFDAEVVRAMHLTRGGHINRLSYTRPIVRAMRRYRFPPISIRVDGQETPIPDCRWCMVFNLARYAAGLSIEPDAEPDDGQLDLIAFLRGSVPSGIRYAAGVASRRHLGFRDVFRRRGVVFELTSASRVPYQLDGDYAGRLPLRIETLPGRVCLLRPP